MFREARTKEAYVPKVETKVAMFSSSLVDRTTMVEEVRLGKEKYRSWEKYPFNKSIWYPGLKITHCYYYYLVRVIFYQLIPSFFLDLLLRLFGIPPIVMSVQRKLFLAISSMEHFVSNVYESSGITDMELLLRMSSRTSFAFPEVKSCLNERTKEWVYNLFSSSSKKYILNEDYTHIKKARIWMKL